MDTLHSGEYVGDAINEAEERHNRRAMQLSFASNMCGHMRTSLQILQHPRSAFSFWEAHATPRNPFLSVLVPFLGKKSCAERPWQQMSMLAAARFERRGLSGEVICLI